MMKIKKVNLVWHQLSNKKMTLNKKYRRMKIRLRNNKNQNKQQNNKKNNNKQLKVQKKSKLRKQVANSVPKLTLTSLEMKVCESSTAKKKILRK
jgi:hypothetical protein